MGKKTEKTPKLIYIEWYDAISNSSGWRDYNESIEWAETSNCIVRESGFVIKETKKYILLANKIVKEDNEFIFGILKKIPKTWIKKRVILIT